MKQNISSSFCYFLEEKDENESFIYHVCINRTRIFVSNLIHSKMRMIFYFILLIFVIPLIYTAVQCILVWNVVDFLLLEYLHTPVLTLALALTP